MDPVSSNAAGPVINEAMLRLPDDDLWAKAEMDRIKIGQTLRGVLKRASGNMHRKRLRSAEPDLGGGLTDWVAQFEDRHDAEPPDTRSTKRRRNTVERKTEDRVAAQRGETQELRARRTSARSEYKSKHGNPGLRRETLVAPPQGVYTPFSPRPTTGTTLGLTEFQDHAWTSTEGSESISEGMEDAHNEETDGERLARLMVREGGRWTCRECPGQSFYDRSTARRHCNSVHGKECDRWKCLLCPDKTYSRKSGLDRHVKEKH